MGNVVGGMTFSLDGFVADSQGDLGRLYPDLVDLRNTEVLQEEIRMTGAIVMGRHSYDMGDPDLWADTYEYQVPIFVLTHQTPEKKPTQNDRLTITFLNTDIKTAITRAKAAAGDKQVLLIGVDINQQCLNARLCDELHIGIMPVLLGDGLRFFENIDPAQITLEKFRLLEAGPRTDLWYRVRYGNKR